MLFVLDNYDSFTFNLVQRFGEIDPHIEIVVRRNDRTTLEEIESLQPDRIVISPGPCSPNEAGLSQHVIEHFGPRLPVLGVCLGHQCMSAVYGGAVERAGRLMHGKTSMVYHDGRGLFAGLSNPFEATRYHSLIVPPDQLPPGFEMCAYTSDDGYEREVMGLRHTEHAIHGVQFHPESFMCIEGIRLLANFLQLPAPHASEAATV